MKSMRLFAPSENVPKLLYLCQPDSTDVAKEMACCKKLGLSWKLFEKSKDCVEINNVHCHPDLTVEEFFKIGAPDKNWKKKNKSKLIQKDNTRKTEEQVDNIPKREEEVDNIETAETDMIVTEIEEPTNEATYRIQIGAFNTTLPSEIFVGVDNVISFTGKVKNITSNSAKSFFKISSSISSKSIPFFKLISEES